MSLKLEAIKSYRIPLDAPIDLIDSYFEVKRKALKSIFSHVKFNGKAHLDFKNNDRKKLDVKIIRE